MSRKAIYTSFDRRIFVPEKYLFFTQIFATYGTVSCQRLQPRYESNPSTLASDSNKLENQSKNLTVRINKHKWRHQRNLSFFDSIYEPIIALLADSGNCSGFNFIIAFNCLEQRSYAFNVLILKLWFSYASMPNYIIHNLYSLRIIKLISVK
jgi:hypothetical protein